ncbi:hypothetical protein N9043_00880 [bacterium]|nr:hypothetical protein [bacterium]
MNEHINEYLEALGELPSDDESLDVSFFLSARINETHGNLLNEYIAKSPLIRDRVFSKPYSDEDKLIMAIVSESFLLGRFSR